MSVKTVDKTVSGKGSFFCLNKVTGSFTEMIVNKRININDNTFGDLSNKVIFCECRNLHKTERLMSGTLAAITTKDHSYEFRLCVILFMNLIQCIVAILDTTSVKTRHEYRFIDKTSEYGICFPHIRSFKTLDDIIKIHYLNRVHGVFPRDLNMSPTLNCPVDNKWQAGMRPDVTIPFEIWPHSWKESKQYMTSLQSNKRFTLTKKQMKKTKTVHKVTLCTDDMSCLKQGSTNDHFYVPLVNNDKQSIDHKYQTFGVMGYSNVRIMLSKGKTTISEHNEFVQSWSKKIVTLKVLDPTILKKPLLLTVKESMVRELAITENLYHEKSAYLDNEVVVSEWDVVEDSYMPYIEDWDLLQKVMLRTYNSIGFGHRGRCMCVGLNAYAGLRSNGKRVHCSPVCGPSMLQHSQYFRENWDLTFMPLVQKQINLLTFHATSHCMERLKHLDILNGTVMGREGSTLRRHCRVSIVTSGSSKAIGFACSQHNDSCDKFKSEDQRNVKRKYIINDGVDRSSIHTGRDKKAEVKTLIEKFGIGVPTTCGYKLCDANVQNYDVILLAYFIIGGFEISVLLSSNLYHVFLGYVFSHSTAVPIIIENGCVLYNHEYINLFAWGASSPSKK